jgi:hypothetical protein
VLEGKHRSVSKSHFSVANSTAMSSSNNNQNSRKAPDRDAPSARDKQDQGQIQPGRKFPLFSCSLFAHQRSSQAENIRSICVFIIHFARKRVTLMFDYKIE